MGHKRTSFAFLTEMLWVCGFFALASCVFVLAFVKADTMSRSAKNLNQAVVAVTNTVEDTFSEYDASLNSGSTFSEETYFYFDKDWTPLGSGAADASPAPEGTAFLITVSAVLKDALLQVTADAADSRGGDIYSLSASHCPRISR